MKNTNSGRHAWRGMTTVVASVLALSLCATPIVNSFRTDIDKFLGTKSTKLVTESTDGVDLYTYKSDYSSTTELLNAIEDLGERMNEEGSVLLKNNGALPLSAEELNHVTLLGYSSYYPVMGGDMGSSLVENSGTDADTVDMVGAFTAKGYRLNTLVQNMYESLKESYKSEIASWGGSITYYKAVAPTTSGYFTSKEPSQAVMNKAQSGWKDSMNDYNVMIVTIARAAGENRSYLPGKAGVDPSQDLNQTDPLGLSDDERDLIAAAVEAKKTNGGKVIVLLNNASAMEIQELADNDGIDAMLEIGLPGGYGFYGVADILSGEANPSGHLADTYVVTNANAPSAQNYGDNQWTITDPETSINDALVEAENIYIGYKYYETRYADTVMGQGNADDTVGSSTGKAWNYDDEVTYPFGFGLSYTTFTQTLDKLDVNTNQNTVTATVTVTNTGSYAGKDVVQLYASAPYTDYDREHGVEKAAVQLLDYAKTKELAPGESQTVTITTDLQYVASWDSTADNAIGTKGCYILDAGDYYFSIGNGSHEAVNNVLAAQGYAVDGESAKAKTWTLDKFDNVSFATTKNGTAVENQLEDMDLNYWMPGTVTYLTRNDWAGTFPKAYTNLTPTEEMLEIMDNDNYEIHANGDPDSVTFGAENGLTLSDLKGISDLTDERWSLLMDQIELEDCLIRLGFGGTSTKAIESIMSPETIQNDGPNGIYSYPLGQYANTDKSSGDTCAVDENDPNLSYKFGTMCNETVIAQTFSKELAAEYGKVIGNYSLWSNLTIFWGAGTNLHRTPYNARNHEYYSEDAMLTSGQATAYVAAGKEYGCIIAPKHLAFNDTEINRTGVAVFMTEQQARENELRGTQACVEDADTLGIMTAYNRVGVYTSNSHTGLMVNILRNEWGFEGLISEDFIMDANYVALKEFAMNYGTMSCNTGESTMEAVSGKYSYWTVENVSQDAELLAAVKQAMTYQAYALANSNAMDGYAPSTRLVSVRTWYDNALTGAQVAFAVLTVLSAAMYVHSVRKSKSKKN